MPPHIDPDDLASGLLSNLDQQRSFIVTIENLSSPSFDETEPFFDEQSHQIRFSLDTLKHHDPIALDEFDLAFEHESDCCSFKLKYKITYAEMLKPMLGELHFRFLDRS